MSSRERDDSRLTTLMLSIFLCFVICFLPLMVTNVIDDDIRFPTFHVVASILAWASSVINPFIYAATNRQYRSAYKKLFKSCRKKPITRRTTIGSKTFCQPTSNHSGNSHDRRIPVKVNSNTWENFNWDKVYPIFLYVHKMNTQLNMYWVLSSLTYYTYNLVSANIRYGDYITFIYEYVSL